MIRCWFGYKILIRKLYKNRVKGRTVAANNLAFGLMVINFISLTVLINFILEVGFNKHLKSNFSIAFIGCVIALVSYFLFKFFLLNGKGHVKVIRSAYMGVKDLSRSNSVLIVTISILCFIASIVTTMLSNK